MGATNKDIEDFSFILDEAIRLKKLQNESHNLYRDDFKNVFEMMGATISVPPDLYERDKTQKIFQFLLSSKAQKTLLEIARRQVLQEKHTYKLTTSEFYHDIRDSIYINIKNGKNFDMAGCSSLLSTAFKRAKQKMKAKEYFFPFNAESVLPTKEILLGAIRIVHKDGIYARVKDQEDLNLLLKNREDSEYNCFLCIKIPKCSDETSKERALNVADFVYGVIKTFATYHQAESRQITLQKNPTTNNINHYITCIENEYSVCSSFNCKDNLEKFWPILEEYFTSDLGLIINKLIERAINPDTKNYLADRLIDSFCWFGDASRDNNNHSQIVKLVTSMERLVTLSIEKKDEGLAKRFSKRVSCLIAVFHGDIETWNKKASQLYSLRSDLVHGTQTLYKSYETPLNFDPFKISCLTILSACVAFYKIDLNTLKYEPKLQIMYEELGEHCKNI